ncbi:NAD(P)/FAD-dependent oxidoreductase [Beijerinckia sp. L45]|uniref:FAD-dependent oxidoreductase n=1 Tax=Beijerinckia sp. L45 TaxID=1641855 RepID=UPI00211049F4|nr:NAD(P)/FAD-dependent oxidoreductase [Beijerinckia sp. L45]
MINKARPVIVVGAGPVGLCLALALSQAGLPVVLIESATDAGFLDQVPRAGTNHPPTLEMFDRIGLYEKIEPRGLVAPVFHYWDRADQQLVAAFDHISLKDDTKFPYVLQCERIKIVEEAMKMAKVDPLIDVMLGTTFLSFEQTADGVDAKIAAEDGTHRVIDGSYIVSAEGARSAVRRQLGIEFEGFTYPDRTLNIEVAYDFKKHGYADRNYISDPGEWSNLFHWVGPPDIWRVHFPTKPDEDPEKLTSPAELQGRLRRFLDMGSDFEVRGSNLYTVHQRVAAKFRAGRALLVGDAAHVNSPIGGMGMNSGIHDAFNLADKLIAIARGEADESVLDRYERQRRQIAIEHTQAQTMRNKRILNETDPVIRRKNHDELKKSAEDPVLARQFMLRASLINSIREAEAIL